MNVYISTMSVHIFRVTVTVVAATLALLLGSGRLYSQAEYTTWYFGDSIGLDFSSGSPVRLYNGGMHSFEGCAVMCDRQTGRVLFYTDGMTVWDSTHAMMQNGLIMRKKPENIIPRDNFFEQFDSVATQSALIVPFPCDSQRYYVFTANCVECLRGTPLQDNEGLHYAVVDMRLNGGRGAVVERNRRLLLRSSERQCATMHANGRDYWVVTQELESYAFHAFPVTCDGVGEPTISRAEDNLRDPIFKSQIWDAGMIKISPDGKRLAISHDEPAIAGFVDVYRFDPTTGRVQDRVHIPHPAYGIAFSPNGERLYTTHLGSRRLYQYDLTQASEEEVVASRVDLGRVSIVYPGSLQLGPDRKLYVISAGFSPAIHNASRTIDFDSLETIISVVEKPDEPGPACEFRYRAIVFPPRAMGLGLPNNIDSRLPPASVQGNSLDPNATHSLALGRSLDSVQVESIPAVGTLSIRASWAKGEALSIALCDLSGRVLERASGDLSSSRFIEFDVGRLPRGAYFVQVLFTTGRLGIGRALVR